MIRRINAPLLAALALFAAVGCAQTQRAWEGTKQTVSGWFSGNSVSADGVAAAELPALVIARANVIPKMGPDAKAKPAGTLRRGDRVARLEVQGNWVRIWIPAGGQVAWVNREAVQPATGGNSVSGTVPFSALLPFRVMAAQASLRETPDPKASVVAGLRQGTELRMLDARAGWLKAADPAGQRLGWIALNAVGRSN